MACLPFLLVVITGTSAVTITQDPPVLSIPEGQSAVMSCEMRGSENRQNLHYYWNLNNTNPDHILKNTTRVTIMSSTLIISPVTADDTGTYICTAWDYNNLHIYQETGTRLLVQEASAVSIIQDPPVLSIPEGQSAVLSCEMRGAENHQTHHYYWNLNNTNPDHILKNTTRVTIMSNILIISPVTANDTGTYICTVRDFNQHFYQGIGAHLLVQGEKRPSVTVGFLWLQDFLGFSKLLGHL
ncbi:uncharacterized protein [Phyllobates terribilis]|uniref:uncharacterized protein n=1 Tax=Phyllobates terribilis TaxID=111132 RepID=UPI003CCB620D